MSSSNETVLAVEGMTCSNCVRHVEAALRGIDGVSAVEVGLKEGRATVQHDPARATTARMIAALDEAGYDARPLAT